MKARLLKVVLAAIVLGVLAGNAWAEPAEPNQPEPAENLQVVKGIVSMTNDRGGNITAVKITADGENEKLVYEVVLDAKGIELGEKMDGKTVHVTGTVETRDTVKWITVKTYTEEPAAKNP